MSNRLTRISPFAKYFSIALLFPLLSLLNSCKDNTGTLGPNVLPKSDLIYALQTDTTTLSTSMYLKDSVYSAATANILLGSYNDPIFGESKASLYAEVGYSSYTFQWPTLPPWVSPSCIVDSAVICLQLSGGNYGSNDPQTFVVYQNDTDVLSPHAYYSDTNIKYTTLMGSQQVNLANSLATDTLRIKLNKNWLNNFAAQLATIGTNNYWTSSFNRVLHGVYITTATPVQLPGQGSLLNILPLAGSFSGIYLYYHYNYPIDTEHYVSFPIGGNSNAFFEHFDHNYSTTYLGGLHPSGKRDSVNGGQLVYVQAMGGVLGRINFPNLYKNWSKLGPIIVNEATITLPSQPENTSSNYGPPSSLYLSGTADTTWAPYQLPDQGQPYYGGTFSNNSYTFVITEYIQSVINGKTIDRGLYIIPNNEAISANGVVLYGAQHGISTATKPVLTIYYTPVKNH